MVIRSPGNPIQSRSASRSSQVDEAMSGKVLRLRSASMSSRIIDGFSHGASLTRDGDVEVSAFMESYHCFACHEEDMLHNLPQIEAHVSIWEKLE